MNVTIRLPEALREMAGGHTELAVQATTVGTALDRLADRFPGIGTQIFNERREPRGFVITFVNDTDSRSLGGVDAPVRDGDVITIVPSIAGGSGTAGRFIPARRRRP